MNVKCGCHAKQEKMKQHMHTGIQTPVIRFLRAALFKAEVRGGLADKVERFAVEIAHDGGVCDRVAQPLCRASDEEKES
eukprot:1949855-Rhodomonas_salina.15